jgi:hypothetical protein
MFAAPPTIGVSNADLKGVIVGNNYQLESPRAIALNRRSTLVKESQVAPIQYILRVVFRANDYAYIAESLTAQQMAMFILDALNHDSSIPADDRNALTNYANDALKYAEEKEGPLLVWSD